MEASQPISFPAAFGSGELKILAVGRRGGGSVARVSDFFLFSKESNTENKRFVLFRGEGKGELASVSKFVVQRILI